MAVKIRNPFPPHEALITVPATEAKYGLLLLDASTASFAVRRNDPAFSDFSYHLQVGAMVSIERTDGRWPWLGFVTKRTSSVGSPLVVLECRDHAGALWAHARTPTTWRETQRDGAAHIRQAFQDADQRAVPPTLARLDLAAGGSPVRYKPKAESLLDMLQTMAETTGMEWGLRYAVEQGGATATLVWRDRLGRDLRNAVVLEQGRHFTAAEYTQDARGFATAALVIGGEGPVDARPSAEAVRVQDAVITPDLPSRSRSPIQRSPALDLTRVNLEPNVDNQEALRAASERLLDAPEWVAESLSLTVLETAFGDDWPVPGDLVTVRFSDIDLGLGLVRVVRIAGMQFAVGSGVIELVTQVVG